MNSKLNFHTEENLNETLTLINEIIETIITTHKLKKDIKDKVKKDFEEIQKTNSLENKTKDKLLKLIMKSYKLLKEIYNIDNSSWSVDERNSFEVMKGLIE